MKKKKKQFKKLKRYINIFVSVCNGTLGTVIQSFIKILVELESREIPENIHTKKFSKKVKDRRRVIDCVFIFSVDLHMSMLTSFMKIPVGVVVVNNNNLKLYSRRL